MTETSEVAPEPERPNRASTSLSDAEVAWLRQFARQRRVRTISAALRVLVIDAMESEQQQGRDTD